MLNGTCHLNHQRGFATLLTSLIILVGITLITLFTARTTLMEQRMSANHYRSSQAFYAAQAALEIGIGYINQNGTDDLLDIDFPPSSHPLLQEYPFINDATLLLKSPANPTNPTNCYHLIATGKSDDQIGHHTISQCVTTLDISRGDGPEQPVISRLGVSLSGSAAVINRYGNTTIWSGDPVTLGNSTKLGTYIRDNNTTLSASTVDLESTDSTKATQIISSSNLGIGFDIIESDPALSGLTANEFFDNTFVLPRGDIKTLAQNTGRLFTDDNIAKIDGLTGLIWIEGDSSLSGNKIIGTSTQPAIVIFNGDADITGTPTIYGLVYVRGQLKIAGTISVVGASVIEGDPTVNATGTINQVFAPSLLQNDNGPPLPGLTVAVAGTWKDWE